MPGVVRWVHRALACGLEDRSIRVMPLVNYPETAQLAQLMLEFEQADVRDRNARTRWLGTGEALMESWELDVQEGTDPLMDWLHHHRARAARKRYRPPGPRRCQLPLAPRHIQLASATGPVEERSCLSW